jgi:hypothetical protein
MSVELFVNGNFYPPDPGDLIGLTTVLKLDGGGQFDMLAAVAGTGSR